MLAGPIHDLMDNRIKGKSYLGNQNDHEAAQDGLGIIPLNGYTIQRTIANELIVQKVLNKVVKSETDLTKTEDILSSLSTGSVGSNEDQTIVNELSGNDSSNSQENIPTVTTGNYDPFSDGSLKAGINFDQNLSIRNHSSSGFWSGVSYSTSDKRLGTASLSFNGSTSFYRIPNYSITPSFTTTMWFKSNTETFNNHGMLISSRQQNGLIIHPNGGSKQIDFYVFDSSGVYNLIGNVNVPSLTNWNFLGFSYNNITGEVILNLNGKFTKFNAPVINRGTSNVYVNLGKDDYPETRVFNGKIDHTLLFNRALTEQELSGIFNIIE